MKPEGPIDGFVRVRPQSRADFQAVEDPESSSSEPTMQRAGAIPETTMPPVKWDGFYGVRTVSLERSAFTVEQAGTIAGRAAVGLLDERQERALENLAALGSVDHSTYSFISDHVATYRPRDYFRKRTTEMAVLVQLLTTPADELTDSQRSVVALFEGIDSQPTPDYRVRATNHDGDFENIVHDWLMEKAPPLAEAVALHHPHIPTKEQMPAVASHAKELAEESGRFLENYNVLTFMHTMGRTPTWLSVMRDQFGLNPDTYLGLSVPYSRSDASQHRANLEGFRTEDGPKETLRSIANRLKAKKGHYHDEHTRLSIRYGLEQMKKLHEQNGQRILIVDDTGHAAQIAAEMGIGDVVDIVGWTKRTSWIFDSSDIRANDFVRGGESRIKTTLEPPIIAAGLIESAEVASVSFKGEPLTETGLTVIGQGDIGATVSSMAAKRGVQVTTNDIKPELATRVQHPNVTWEPDLDAALADAEVVMAVTGHTPLPSEVREKAKPGAVWTSGSSNDIEYRDDYTPYNNWRYDYFIPQGQQRKSSGGYVSNLSRRARETPLEWEELIMMIMMESMAQAVTTHVEDDADTHLASRRDDRIERIYGEHHPDDLEFFRENYVPKPQ